MRHFVITILRWLIQINRQVAFAVVMMVPALAQENISQLYAEAQQAQASNDLATAILKYEAIIRLQPGLAEAYANLGNLY